ncbi:MAG: DNA integrity scanning protein DisA nucleotide-binding domain protein [Planctomycetota bacterium]
MSKNIDHFMWGYQRHFRIIQDVHAQTLFGDIDDRIEPEVFIVGIRLEGSDGPFPACVEPENDFWIKSEAFDGVWSIVENLVANYSESKLFHTHPVAQEMENERLIKKAVCEAILQIIAQSDDRPRGLEFFISWPVVVGHYWVTLVLGLQSDVVRSFPYLSIGEVALHELRSIKIATSFIQSLIDIFLEDVSDQLLKPDPGRGAGLAKSPDDIRRAAGIRMMSAIAWKTDSWSNQNGSHDLLFERCNRIAALPYERGAPKGRALITRRDNPSIQSHIAFECPVQLTNARAARKVLELASGSLSIHMNSAEMWGLVEHSDYQSESEDLFEVVITGHHKWELRHNGKSMMHVRDSIPSLPKPTFDCKKLSIDLRRIFTDISQDSTSRLIELVVAAERQEHGTMLLISQDATNEAKRLENQATLIAPCHLTPNILEQLTSIDGAVLIDPDAVCHAIGVILDGMATSSGDSSRGARFNSAIRYTETRGCRCLAIVISEDGGVDFVPNLKPPIQRTEIDSRVAELEKISDMRVGRVRRYLKIINWLRDRRFYLNEEHCGKLNTFVADIERQDQMIDPSSVRVIYREFVPFDGGSERPCYEEDLKVS